MAIAKNSERIRFSSTIRKDLYERLQDRSNDTDIPITKLLDRAVEAYLNQPKREPEPSE